MNHISEIILGALITILGVMTTAFFNLLWRRLDSIDKTIAAMQVDLKQTVTKADFTKAIDKLDATLSDSKKLEGRVEEISKRVR
jgi:uncharacterized protein YoxC